MSSEGPNNSPERPWPAGRRLQGPRGGENLVEVGQLVVRVLPGTADDPLRVEQEGAPARDVAHPPVLEGDAEAARRLGVPVGEQREVEVEGLRPGDVGVRRVARDGIRPDAGLAQLLAPVTQELELARSGRRPVEEVEEQQKRTAPEQVADRRPLARRRPDRRLQRRPLALGRDLRRLHDLAHDVDDVARRAEDAELAVGAVAAPEDLLDPAELLLASELARLRAQRLQRPPHEGGDRQPVAAAGLEVDHRGGEPVAGGEPLVLARQDAVEGGDLHAPLDELGVVLHERLAVGGDRDRVVEPADGVADPDLDRAQAGMEADVPPDVGVVLDAAGLLELVDDLGVVGVVAETRRQARAREGGEDHVTGGVEAGRLSAPERGAGRERDELWQVGDQPVHHLDRLLRSVDGDVHVHPEDQLAAGDVLHLVGERPVAVARRDPLPLEEREGVGAGRADPQALAPRHVRDVAADAQELLPYAGRRVADRGRHLEHRLHQLGVEVRLELVPGRRGEHGVDVLDEVERLAVEEHVLLLHPQRVGVARAEGVLEHAAAGREAHALAGDRGRDQRVAHAVTISPVGAGRTRRPATTSGIPITSEEAILPTSWPAKKWSPAEPKASTRKTALSIGALAPEETATRKPSCTRPRSGAPTRLSTVSEARNAARLAPTIRQVEPTARSNSWPGKAGWEWTTRAM